MDSETLLERLNALFDTKLADLENRLDKRFGDLSKQQGDLWETTIRQSVQWQFGHNFSKEFTILSIQHLAKLICRSTGWELGSTVVDVYDVTRKLATTIVKGHFADKLVREVFQALTSVKNGQHVFAELGREIADDPWIDKDGQLDLKAYGRSLSKMGADNNKHRDIIKSKMVKLHEFLDMQKSKGKQTSSVDMRQDDSRCFATHIKTCTSKPLKLTDSCCHAELSEVIMHLLTCRSVGVMLALYASSDHLKIEESASYQDLAERLPFLQLQVDVRGKINIIDNQVTIEVGEIKRNAKQYQKGKKQLLQRARLLKWAIKSVVDKKNLQFVLIGHLFIPRNKIPDEVQNSEMEEEVSIFTHKL